MKLLIEPIRMKKNLETYHGYDMDYMDQTGVMIRDSLAGNGSSQIYGDGTASQIAPSTPSQFNLQSTSSIQTIESKVEFVWSSAATASANSA